MKKLLVICILALTPSLVHAQLKPGAEIVLGGFTINQDLGSGYTGIIKCLNRTVFGHKNPVCKANKSFYGTLDVCDGKVQSIMVITDTARYTQIDGAFIKAVNFAKEDFGEPSTVSNSEADWNMGDAQVMVHIVAPPDSLYWDVMMDLFSRHSLRSETGCTADGSGKYGKALPAEQ